MTKKTVALALALTVLPAFAFAYCSGGYTEQAVSCATGTVWDAASQTCVEQVSS